MRRHKVQGSHAIPYVPSVVNINRKEGNAIQNLIPSNKLKKMYDHSPHEVFVQLGKSMLLFAFILDFSYNPSF